MSEQKKVMSEAEAVFWLAENVMGWNYMPTQGIGGGQWDCGKGKLATEKFWNPFDTYHVAHQLVQRVGELGKKERLIPALEAEVGKETYWYYDYERTFLIAQATPRQRTLAVLAVYGITVEQTNV